MGLSVPSCGLPQRMKFSKSSYFHVFHIKSLNFIGLTIKHLSCGSIQVLPGCLCYCSVLNRSKPENVFFSHFILIQGFRMLNLTSHTVKSRLRNVYKSLSNENVSFSRILHLSLTCKWSNIAKVFCWPLSVFKS